MSRRLAVAVVSALPILICNWAFSADGPPERQKVFNGENLEGWVVSRCEAAVEDGLLVLQEGNGLVYLEGPYRDFIFEFKWRARSSEMWDSGIYFRCEPPPETEKRPWPKQHQLNLRKGMEGDVSTLADARSEGLTRPGEWNEMKLTVVGPAARLEFNGQTAWEAEGLEEEQGIIALQAEVPGGGQFEFKDIYVTTLERKSLFHGRDLGGWKNINCAPSTWRVEEGMIRCTGFPTGQMRTEGMFENFILEVEWRHLLPQGNAGVMVWADGITAVGVPFCRAIEVQVLDGREGPGYTSDGDVFPIHGATMKPENGRGSMRAFPTEKRARPSPEWNLYRVTCLDGSISLAVNGKVVTRGSESSLRRGYICLESEGSPVDFRNVRITELPPSATPLDPEQVALEVSNAHPFAPLYSGVDLAGWRGGLDGWQSQDWRLVCDAAAPSTIWTREHYGDFELIVDVRLPKDAAGDRAAILIGESGGAGLCRIGLPADPSGKWRRYRILRENQRLALTLDNERIEIRRNRETLPASVAIGLAVESGPVQWANLLLRPTGSEQAPRSVRDSGK